MYLFARVLLTLFILLVISVRVQLTQSSQGVCHCDRTECQWATGIQMIGPNDLLPAIAAHPHIRASSVHRFQKKAGWWESMHRENREKWEKEKREEIDREWKENWKSEEKGKQEWEQIEPQRRAFHFRRLRPGSVSTTRDVVLSSFHVAECFIRANAVTIYRGHALLLIRRHVMRRMSSAEIVDAKKRLVSFAFLESCRNEVA